MDRFVCFHDDPSLQWFFTITINGYNERWALLDKAKDDTEARRTMRSIDAAQPDVDFIGDAVLAGMDGLFGKGTETYLRSGGLALFYTTYYKGVMTNSEFFRGTEYMWTFDLTPDLNQTDKILLSFEPTTLRYVQRASGKVLVSGMCEKIPRKQSN